MGGCESSDDTQKVSLDNTQGYQEINLRAVHTKNYNDNYNQVLKIVVYKNSKEDQQYC